MEDSPGPIIPTKVKTKREKKMCQVTGKGRFSLQSDDAVAPSGIPVLGLLVALHCRKAMFLSLYETPLTSTHLGLVVANPIVLSRQN